MRTVCVNSLTHRQLSPLTHGLKLASLLVLDSHETSPASNECGGHFYQTEVEVKHQVQKWNCFNCPDTAVMKQSRLRQCCNFLYSVSVADSWMKIRKRCNIQHILVQYIARTCKRTDDPTIKVHFLDKDHGAQQEVVMNLCLNSSRNSAFIPTLKTQLLESRNHGWAVNQPQGDT